MKYKRILIIGPAGAGKTKLARELSIKLKIPHKEIDDFIFIKKFNIFRDKEERKKLLKKYSKKEKWIIDGVSSSWTKNAFKRAQLIIWLDFPHWLLILRIFKRFFMRRNNPNLKENFIDQFTLFKYNIKY